MYCCSCEKDYFYSKIFEYLKFIRSLKVKIPKLKRRYLEEILYHLNCSSLKMLETLIAKLAALIGLYISK